jgi:alpha-ketoglutarate-dependent taurine dioxygenase
MYCETRRKNHDSEFLVPFRSPLSVADQIVQSFPLTRLSGCRFSTTTESIKEELLKQSLSTMMTTELPSIKPHVTVDPNGLFVCIQFPNDYTSKSIFHSPWLWSNDPSKIHPTSGQRRGSNIEYFSGQWKISCATIVEMDSIHIVSPRLSSSVSSFNENSKDDSKSVTTQSEQSESVHSTIVAIPFPPKGSLHPIGGVYDVVFLEKKTQQHEYVNPMMENRRQVLQVRWESEKLNQIRDSCYDLDWLHQCRYDTSSLQIRKNKTRIGHTNSINATTKFGRFCYESLCETSRRIDGKFDILHAIATHGVAIVENAISSSKNGSYDYPSHENETDESDATMRLAPVVYMGKLLGSNLSHGNLYGNIFHVEAKPDANNIAYTSEALCPHQDLAYYESPPGLQLLHCVKNYGIVGGQSTLIDCIAAAEVFRVIAPELFDILVQADATFIKQRPGADLCYRRPHIQLASSNRNWNSKNKCDTEVVSVRWSPPFEGPLSIGNENVEKYFVAYSAFQRMLDSAFPQNERLLPCIPEILEVELATYAADNTVEYMLKPGEMLIFNNQRLLHGRRIFRVDNHKNNQDLANSDVSFGRHLIGCYTNIDDTLNEYRLLRRSRIFSETNDRLDTKYIPIIGNGSSSNY